MNLYLLYTLLRQVPVNFGYLMLKYLEVNIKDQRRSLPYGMLITKILRHHNIPFENATMYPTSPRNFYDLRFLKSMSIYVVNGEWTFEKPVGGFDDYDYMMGGEDEEDDAHEDIAQEQAVPTPPRATPVDDDFKTLIQGYFDSVVDRIDSGFAGLQSNMDDMRSQLDELTLRVDDLGNEIHYGHEVLMTDEQRQALAQARLKAKAPARD